MLKAGWPKDKTERRGFGQHAILAVSVMLVVQFVTAESPSKVSQPQLEELGKQLFTDPNLSAQRNLSCSSCHAITLQPGQRYPSFIDERNKAALHAGLLDQAAVSNGSLAGKRTTLNSPGLAYIAENGPLRYDVKAQAWFGGFFYNGRASNLIEQAEEPLLNPDEMGMPGKAAVVERLQENEKYIQQFKQLFNLDLNIVDTRRDNAGSDRAFSRMLEAIAAFEATPLFRPYTSKYDFYLAGKLSLSSQELEGLLLYQSKVACSKCHPQRLRPGPDGSVAPPLFTDFSYHNLGLPQNVSVSKESEPNPGLAGNSQVIAAGMAGKARGKHRTPTLRNIALTAPYGHNGVFNSLLQIIQFYNNRDTLQTVCKDNLSADFGVGCWPAAEITENLNTEDMGMLGLSANEELALVAFMEALTDGYPEWSDDPRVPPGTPSPY